MKTDHMRKVDAEYQRRKRATRKKEKDQERAIYNKKYPERKNANLIVYRAIKKGKLKRDKCRDCDRIDTQGHHPDYTKPLEVIWLCPIHHKLEDMKKVVKLKK